jgi:hypothetical protein
MAPWQPDPSFYPSPRQAAKAPPETIAYVAAFDPGCVKTRRCGEQIEWTFRQITIRVMRILKRGQFRSIRERSFFSFSSFWGFHTAWTRTGPNWVIPGGARQF